MLILLKVDIWNDFKVLKYFNSIGFKIFEFIINIK
jgi:hypothetical protein